MIGHNKHMEAVYEWVKVFMIQKRRNLKDFPCNFASLRL